MITVHITITHNYKHTYVHVSKSKQHKAASVTHQSEGYVANKKKKPKSNIPDYLQL